MHSCTEYACGIVGGGAKQRHRRRGVRPGDRADAAAPTTAASPACFHSLTAFDTHDLAAAIRTHAPGLAHAGCTTAGEMLPTGISDGQALAILLPRERFTVVSAMIDNIGSTSMDGIAATVERLKRELAEATAGRPGLGRFALCLIDGMSFAEEAVTAAFHWALDDIPLIGGSAGDDLQVRDDDADQQRTRRIGLRHHRADRDRRSLPRLQDRELRADRREAGGHRFGSRTAASCTNSTPAIAAEEFAAAVGILPDQLTPMSLASHPVVVRVGGEYYCRSIQKVNADGSLSFFCAIDDGIVLSIAQPQGHGGIDAQRARGTFASGSAASTWCSAFDCVLRRLDARNRQVFRDMSELYRANNVIGFGTYGEQYRSMHLNQTLTGIAFGDAAGSGVGADVRSATSTTSTG